MTEPTPAPARGPAWRFSAWSVAWIVWILFFLVVEGWALFSKRDPGGTFSENWWAFFRVHDRVPWWVRVPLASVLVLFGVWLTGHLVFGWWTWSPR